MRMGKKMQAWFTCTWVLAYTVAAAFVLQAALAA